MAPRPDIVPEYAFSYFIIISHLTLHFSSSLKKSWGVQKELNMMLTLKTSSNVMKVPKCGPKNSRMQQKVFFNRILVSVNFTDWLSSLVEIRLEVGKLAVATCSAVTWFLEGKELLILVFLILRDLTCQNFHMDQKIKIDLLSEMSTEMKILTHEIF